MLVHLTQIKIPHSQCSTNLTQGRVGGWLVCEQVRPCKIISADFLPTSFGEFYTSYFADFYLGAGGFPARHFAQHSIHRRIFNELNHCLFHNQCCGTITIFKFRLLKSYGSGSGSDFWKSYGSGSGSGSYFRKVPVPVPVLVPAPYLDRKKQIFQKKFWNFFAFLHSKLF
jgi:hypothetical protein